MHLLREIRSLGCTVFQTESGEHVAFGCRAYAGAASLGRLGLDLEPQVALGRLHFLGLGVAVNLFENQVNLLHLEVDDVVHDALGFADMLLEQFKIEFGLWCEGILYITVKVDGQQTATVVRA